MGLAIPLKRRVAGLEALKPGAVGVLVDPVLFADLFKSHSPNVAGTLGLQPFRMHGSEIWLLGSTTKVLRGEALAAQEDAFFALGERIGAGGSDAGGT